MTRMESAFVARRQAAPKMSCNPSTSLSSGRRRFNCGRMRMKHDRTAAGRSNNADQAGRLRSRLSGGGAWLALRLLLRRAAD